MNIVIVALLILLVLSLVMFFIGWCACAINAHEKDYDERVQRDASQEERWNEKFVTRDIEDITILPPEE